MKQVLLGVVFSLAICSATLTVLGVAVATPSCAKAPPTLTPEASIAFKATQAVHALDLLRDTATTANAQTPPLLTTEVTRKVVLYHQSTVKVIQSSPGGWKVIAETGLDEVTKNLSSADRQTLEPYIALVRAILAEVK